MQRCFGIILLFMAALISGCAQKTDSGAPQSQTRDNLLGTVITVSIYEEADERVFDDVFERISRIDRAMSANRSDSEIAKVSDMAGISPVVVSDETYFVVRKAHEISVQSNGAFDLTIAPLVELWGITGESPRVPTQAEIADVQQRMDYEAVVLSDADKSVFLPREGMRIDLGAIAKGYAGDAAAQIVRDHGVRHAILDLGGNIVTIGDKPDGAAWKVGIKSPIVGESGHIGFIPVTDKAVVTSGVYERYFERDGRFYHHIFDGSTGYPADSGLLSVTVVSDSSTEADMLTTPAFVLGLRNGMDFLMDYEGIEAIFITNDREIHLTQGIKDAFTLVDSRFRVVGE